MTEEVTILDLGLDPELVGEISRQPDFTFFGVPRDPGSYIGNQAWQGVAGDPMKGTHNGVLDADARKRRAIKNARYHARKGFKAR